MRATCKNSLILTCFTFSFHLRSSAKSIIEDFNKNPVCSIAQAITSIRELTGIERKPTQVRGFMHKYGFNYRKLASVPGKLNPEQQKQFFEQQLTPSMEKAPKGEIKLLFCDVAHFTLSAFYAWFGRKSGPI
ncbi:MAG: winged helix-turn-helix domain-containing protein [Tannerella sp.]|jgi:hypothetical protein|nr:winged helix-turn-helix domain-containing protein [Tannerella sp.]